MDLDEHERVLRNSPGVVKDKQLDAFVRDVLCQTVGSERCAAIRIYIIKDRSLNAAMAPNGFLEVNTGLLARLHSEAELAAVLGHEFAHFEQRHTLKEFLQRRKASDWSSWIALIGAATAVNTSDTRREIALSVYAFSRAEETEADRLGGVFVISSHYRLCASDVWRRAVEEDDALRKERGLQKVRRLTPSLTDDHPTSEQRFAYFKDIEAKAPDHGVDGAERYRIETDRVLPMLMEPLVKGNDFAVAEYVIRTRGEALGWSAALLTMQGDLYRLRGSPRDLVNALDFYKRASAKEDASAETWRGLGLTQFRLGDPINGRVALSKYLNLAPTAADAATVKLLMGE